jgi:hypothetical protein
MQLVNGHASGSCCGQTVPHRPPPSQAQWLLEEEVPAPARLTRQPRPEEDGRHDGGPVAIYLLKVTALARSRGLAWKNASVAPDHKT